ncbi:MAG: diphthine synthase [Nitrososphaerales archaeon]
MLAFIGLGLDQSPSLKALEEMKKCDVILLESYTSPVLNENIVTTLRSDLGDKLQLVKREFIEDGRKIIDLSKTGCVAILTSGDPLVATTHQELRERALKEGVKTKIIHGSSILSSIQGELGLHSYNFGRVVTMTDEPMQYTAYNTIYENLLRGLHTTILLQWDESRGFFLSPASAVNKLLEAENDMKYEILSSKTLVLIASRLGTDASSTIACFVEDLAKIKIGEPPHSIVIPGKLHFTEREALSAITAHEPAYFVDNSLKIERLSARMLQKYSKKTLAALERARRAATLKKNTNANFDEIFENVECYTQDALRFLNEGKEELAVLSIGYAEGLLDSLRFGGMLDFEW